MSRCEDWHGSLRCQGADDHPGPHWANTGGTRGARWGLADFGCIVGIEAGLVCMEKGDHAIHRGTANGRMMSWGDPLDSPM